MASLTAQFHPGTEADLQPIVVSSVVYKEALIFQWSSCTETNPQSLPLTSVARNTTINSSSFRGTGNNASSGRKHHSTFSWIGQISWELERILVYVKNTASEKIECSAIDGIYRKVKI